VQTVDFRLAKATVKLLNEGKSGGFQTKDFSLKANSGSSSSSGGASQLNTKMVFCPEWPHCVTSLPSVADLPQVVSSLLRSGREGPVLVIDRYGGTEAATFAALSSLLAQMESEGHADVYAYARASHRQRPGIWRTRDQYFALYQVLDAVCGDGTMAEGEHCYQAASAAAAAVSTFQTFQPTFYVSNGAAGSSHTVSSAALMTPSSETTSTASTARASERSVQGPPPLTLRPTAEAYQRY
jgi:hypothetical protein